MLLSQFLFALAPTDDDATPFHDAISGKQFGTSWCLPKDLADSLTAARKAAAVGESSMSYAKKLEYADALHPILGHDMILPPVGTIIKSGIAGPQQSLRYFSMFDRKKEHAHNTFTGEYIIMRLSIAARILYRSRVLITGPLSLTVFNFDASAGLRLAAEQIGICIAALRASRLSQRVIAECSAACGLDTRLSLENLHCSLLCMKETLDKMRSPTPLFGRWQRLIKDGRTFPLEAECNIFAAHAMANAAREAIRHLATTMMDAVEEFPAYLFIWLTSATYCSLEEKDSIPGLQRYCRAHLWDIERRDIALLPENFKTPKDDAEAVVKKCLADFLSYYGLEPASDPVNEEVVEIVPSDLRHVIGYDYTDLSVAHRAYWLAEQVEKDEEWVKTYGSFPLELKSWLQSRKKSDEVEFH